MRFVYYQLQTNIHNISNVYKMVTVSLQ